jgi:hypothetical protein
MPRNLKKRFFIQPLQKLIGSWATADVEQPMCFKKKKKTNLIIRYRYPANISG